MLYNSIEFLVFFLFAVIIYYLIPKKIQWVYLLVVSYCYYFTFEAGYTILLLGTTTITYMASRLISNNDNIVRKKIYLACCIILNVCLLGGYKYLIWIMDVFTQFAPLRFQLWYRESSFNIIVPVGISFYTFRVISYMIDVYRGKVVAEKNWGKYALYVSFFPQIVSGPIERSYNFFPQLEKEHHFDYDTVKNGFLLFLWGLLKKIVIADRLGILVDQVFNNIADYGAPDYCLAILFFTFQIYFDFAGYSDMAIGCTNMLGMTSIRNFDRPYFAKSITEFWRRWHISLSSWFRDYLYIPLGGNRVNAFRWAVNIMIVFLVSGLWHGANWTFLIWGGVMGFIKLLVSLQKI